MERTSTAIARTPRSRRRGLVKLTVCLVLAFSAIVLVPVVLFNTPMRDRALASAIDNPKLSATAGSARGGWWRPIEFFDMRVSNADGSFACSIGSLRTSNGLFSVLFSNDERGPISAEHVAVEVAADQEGNWPDLKSPDNTSSNGNFPFSISDLNVRMTAPWRELPIVDVAEVTLSGAIGPDERGQRWLTIDPVTIEQRGDTWDAQMQQNLSLVAPVLAQATKVSGSATVQLEEMRIALNRDEPQSLFPLRGVVTFHELNAELQAQWAQSLSMLTGQVTGREVPSRISVVKESTVAFAVTDAGIEHAGMTFLLPQVATGLSVESSGLIRTDETLDLDLVVTLPPVLPANRPLLTMLAQLSSEPLKLRVTGTVNDPRLELPEGSTVLSELTKRVAPAGFEQPSSANPAGSDDLPSGILNIIREIQEAKQARDANRPPRERPRRRR